MWVYSWGIRLHRALVHSHPGPGRCPDLGRILQGSIKSQGRAVLRRLTVFIAAQGEPNLLYPILGARNHLSWPKAVDFELLFGFFGPCTIAEHCSGLKLDPCKDLDLFATRLFIDTLQYAGTRDQDAGDRESCSIKHFYKDCMAICPATSI